MLKYVNENRDWTISSVLAYLRKEPDATITYKGARIGPKYAMVHQGWVPLSDEAAKLIIKKGKLVEQTWVQGWDVAAPTDFKRWILPQHRKEG